MVKFNCFSTLNKQGGQLYEDGWNVKGEVNEIRQSILFIEQKYFNINFAELRLQF